MSATDPGTLFGGTWQRIQDRFLLCAGTSYASGSTGGEASVTLAANNVPSHTHPFFTGSGSDYGDQTDYPYIGAIRGSRYVGETYTKAVGNSTGGNQPHNNMPPYLAVYAWKRTA